jgi:transposase-like protein
MVGRRRMITVKHRRHTPDHIVRKLREAEKLIAEGADVPTVCRHLEISEQTFHRWRNQYGGMKADDAKRLKELEKENLRLKRIVADQALDISALKDVAEGKF